MYPSLEVTAATIIRHSIFPGNVRLLLWKAGDIQPNLTKVGYAIYASGKKDPVFQGYQVFQSDLVATETVALEVMGLVLLSAWDPTSLAHNTENYATEYSESQIDWLNTSEVLFLVELLDLYQAETLGEVDEQDLTLEWRSCKLYFRNGKSFITEVTAN